MQLFDCFQYEMVILVEDDMLFAPDFFSYFEATSTLLDQVRIKLLTPKSNPIKTLIP